MNKNKKKVVPPKKSKTIKGGEYYKVYDPKTGKYKIVQSDSGCPVGGIAL